jgi:uncharacterized membrane protein YagU involved in acid resistance
MNLEIHWANLLFWGFVASSALVAIESVAQSLGLTRLNLPLLLGTALTPDRDRARAIGVLLHIAMGWLFSLFYVVAMAFLGGPSWNHGAIIGLAHALLICVIGLQILPGIHPRMASETHGPSATRMLEPPGFMGLNYGLSTPVSVFVTHAIFGIIMGAFYR